MRRQIKLWQIKKWQIKLWQIKKWLLFLGLFLGIAAPASAQFSRITSVTMANNNNSQAAFYASPFTLKVGADCTWSIAGTVATINCAGGGGATPGGATGTVQYNAGGGLFGGIAGVLGAQTNCDGFMDGCLLNYRGTTGSFGVPYFYCGNVVGGPAGNYGCYSLSDDGGELTWTLDAYDGTNYSYWSLNSRTGLKSFNYMTAFVYNTTSGSGPGSVTCPTITICAVAPASMPAAYKVQLPSLAGAGTLGARLVAGVVEQGYSGDSQHAATVVIGSGTSIGSTALCAGGVCAPGTYRINAYLDITTPCGVSGTYLVNLIYTDDQGAKTVPINLSGTGAVPATGVVTTTSTANFGQASQILRLASGAINYSTTAVACGAAGPMVGNLYLSTEPVQ